MAVRSLYDRDGEVTPLTYLGNIFNPYPMYCFPLESKLVEIVLK